MRYSNLKDFVHFEIESTKPLESSGTLLGVSKIKLLVLRSRQRNEPHYWMEPYHDAASSALNCSTENI
jgi:hypothetical protein